MRFKVIAVNLLVLLGLLAVLEIGLRIASPDYVYYYRTHHQQPNLQELLAKTDTNWLQVDETLGWICQQKSDLLFPTPPVEGISYQINSQGFRNSFDFTDTVSTEKKRILLLGDSFTFGIYLSEEQTITSHLRKAMGDSCIFYTVAVPAWGLDQMYLAYQKYVDLIQPDQVVLAFVDDDLFRSLEILYHGCAIKPCFKLEGGQLVDNNDPPHWWEHLCWNNQIGNRILRIYYERKAADLGRFMLEDVVQKEIAAGRRPALIRIPAFVDLEGEVPRKLFDMSTMAQTYEVPYIQLYDTLSPLPIDLLRIYYIPDDGHPTAKGAELLSKYFLECIE